MIRLCLFCHREFPGNEVLEHFPRGARVAFDPARGRLWAICGGCRRWTLAPIEERWEALEELEQLTTDRARPLSQTENIALFEAGPLEVVRVGRARLAEEAWWRYGRELLSRRKRARGLNVAQQVVMGAVLLAGGPFFFWLGGDALVGLDRWLRYGGVAWRGERRCERCGRPLRVLRFKQTERMRLATAEGGGEASLALTLPCPSCRSRRLDSRVLIDGVEGERLLRRVMAHRHHTGASERRILEATREIERAGSPTALVRGLAADRPALRSLGAQQNRTRSVALEIALNDEAERRLLELELRELERRWREEEEIAAIVDRELTPVPLLAALRRRMGSPA